MAGSGSSSVARQMKRNVPSGMDMALKYASLPFSFHSSRILSGASREGSRLNRSKKGAIRRTASSMLR